MLTLFLKSSTKPLIAILARVTDNHVEIIDQVDYKEIVDGKSSEMMLYAINQLLEQQNILMGDIQQIVVASGPGSYTGARVLVSIIKTIFLLQPDLKLYDASMLKNFDKMNGDLSFNHLGIVYARRGKFYIEGVLNDEYVGASVVEETFLNSLDTGQLYINGMPAVTSSFIEASERQMDVNIWWAIAKQVNDVLAFEPFYLESVQMS